MQLEFVWPSVVVGAGLCSVGLALTWAAVPITRLLNEYRLVRDLRLQVGTLDQWIGPPVAIVRISGYVCIGFGVALLLFTGYEIWRNAPETSAQTNEEFEQVSQQQKSGQNFDGAVDSFLLALRGPHGYVTANPTFRAVAEDPICDVRLKSCAPSPSAAPVREWEGELTWQESRPAGPISTQSCQVLVILTQAEGWRIEGSRWCDLLPR